MKIFEGQSKTTHEITQFIIEPFSFDQKEIKLNEKEIQELKRIISAAKLNNFQMLALENAANTLLL